MFALSAMVEKILGVIIFMNRLTIFSVFFTLTIISTQNAYSAKCGNTGSGFKKWLSATKKQAVAKGLSKRTVSASLNGLTYNRRVIYLDRNQKSFKLSFRAFYRKRVNNAMIKKARSKIKQYRHTLNRIEKRFGVPPEILTAIWALETNFGSYRGKMPIMRALATLAYDCRRSKFFTNELYSAMKIVERGDMKPRQMRGAWAGEIGQTQFLMSTYYKFAIDFDGNRKADLIRSVPDVLASTANYLKSYGWKRGGSWNPGSANYKVLQQWNRAEVYSKTIAVVANKISGR